MQLIVFFYSTDHSNKSCESPTSIECPDLRSLGPNVTLITLNNEGCMAHSIFDNSNWWKTVKLG